MEKKPPVTGELRARGNLSFDAQRSPTHRHRGIDLPRAEGTAVTAAAPGVVTHASAQWEQGFSGYGAHVVVKQDDGTHALYAHLSSVDVEPGERVQAGELLGAVGRTAYTAADHSALLSSGPHLHWEVSPRAYPQPSESARLDPLAWLADTDDGGTRTMASTINDLSSAWNALRNAALGRGTKPLVSPALATEVGSAYDAWRAWLAAQGPGLDLGSQITYGSEAEAFVRKYMALAGRVASETGKTLPDAPVPPVERTVRSAVGLTASMAWGIAAVVAAYALTQATRGRR